MRRRTKAGLVAGATLACALGLAAVAYATFVAAVRYDPPRIVYVDEFEQGTVEDLTVTKDGRRYVFENPLGSVKQADSKPGCTDDFAVEYKCPVAGIKRITLKLGAMSDTARIDLANRAFDVRQVLRGGTGDDTLRGARGRQLETGDDGADTLRGGPGADFLDGGPGADDCIGGRGRDVIRHCE